MTHTTTPPAPGKKLGLQVAGANTGFARAAYLRDMPTNRGSLIFKFAVSGTWRDADGILMVRVETDSHLFFDMTAEDFIRNKGVYQIRTIPPDQYSAVIRQLTSEEREAFYQKSEAPAPIDFGAATFGGTCRLQSVSVDVDSGDPVVVFARSGSNALYRDPQLTKPYRPDDMDELRQAQEDNRVIIKATLADDSACRPATTP